MWDENGQYYTIGSAGQFAEFGRWVNEGKNTSLTYRFTADIRLDSDDWTPIGIDNTTNKYFNGVLSGDGHTVSGFKVVGKHKHAGLFGYSKGSISNLGVTDFVVSVENFQNLYAGGLVGNNDGGSITGSYTMGSVTAASSNTAVHAGGLVGSNINKGMITGSYAMDSVNGITKSTEYINVGGLAGQNQGTITASYAAGRVSFSANRANVGGFVGDNSSGTIQNCVFDTQAAGQINAAAVGKEGTAYKVFGAPTGGDIWTSVDVFSDDRWVAAAGCYPQLKVFADENANAGNETAREASALSAVPVFLASRDEPGEGPEKDTASNVTGAFLIPKRTPPVSGKKIGLKWTVSPENALRYTESGNLWEITAGLAGEAELTAETPKAKKRFKLRIAQNFGDEGGGLLPIPEPQPEPEPEPLPTPTPTPVPAPPPAPVPPAPEIDRLGGATADFNEEYGNKGVQIEFPKYGPDDPKDIGEQLGEKNIAVVGNFDAERVVLTPEDGAGLAGEMDLEMDLPKLGGGYGAALEVSLGAAAEDGEIDLLPVLLTFVLTSGDLEEAGLDAHRAAGNTEAFLEKTAVVKRPADGSERTPFRLNGLLKDILIVSLDERPENPGGVQVLLPYLLADGAGAPKLVRDGRTDWLVLFDGSKNGCLRDPIWLYRAAEPTEPEEPETPENPEDENPESDKPEGETPESPSLAVSPNRLSLPENESREVTVFVSGDASGLGVHRIVWRVEDESVASIRQESEDGEGELGESGKLGMPGVSDVWVVTGLEEGRTKMTASARSLPDDAELLSANLTVRVTAENREPAAEPGRGGCYAPGPGAAETVLGMTLALTLCLAPAARRRGMKKNILKR
ncbi:MAG: hypothetical protein LBO82_01595 [Synergistaceae bacterium]|nr:hypothetical protein [Synergistaceae bacterium]